MRIILGTWAVILLWSACGKIEVEDSEHTVKLEAGICDVFDDPEEKKDCVRKVLTAIEKECAK